MKEEIYDDMDELLLLGDESLCQYTKLPLENNDMMNEVNPPLGTY